ILCAVHLYDPGRRHRITLLLTHHRWSRRRGSHPSTTRPAANVVARDRKSKSSKRNIDPRSSGEGSINCAWDSQRKPESTQSLACWPNNILEGTLGRHEDMFDSIGNTRKWRRAPHGFDGVLIQESES